jgi:two-component system response regulator VicR
MNKVAKIIVIEDSENMVETITLALQVRWPDVKVVSTGLGRDGIELVKNEKPEVIILDLGLPDINGYEVLKSLRLFCDTPVIILTARKDEEDIIKGLELGANDYIVKPFRQMELLSRVNVQIRKDTLTTEEPQVICGEIKLDLNAQTIQANGKLINLTPLEMKLMKTLMKNAGTVLGHTTLAKAVWDDYYEDAPYNLKVHVRHLRQKIEIDPNKPRIILTKPHAGYYILKS